MIKTNITGECMIFRKDFEDRVSYSTTLSKKEKGGTYTNCWIGIQFGKDVSFINKTKIDIKNAWLTFYIGKDGKDTKYIFCNEFERLSGVPSGFEEVTEFASLDEDIPF